MFFSLKTIATVAAAGLLSAPAGVSAAAIEERSTSLCNQANYGASGYPWQSSSTPGSFCSSTKPSNSKYWKQIPFSDGYDTVRCSTSSKSKYNVCSGGNKKSSLPSKCNPPHRHSSSTKVSSTSTKATSTSTSLTKAATSTSVIVSSAAAASSASSSAAAASLVAASAVSSAASSSSVAAITAAVTSATSAITAAITDPVTASVTSTAASSTTTISPLSDPVCELQYQATYLNYTTVAQNGVWEGMTMGAAAQDASYLTYTLATSVDDCLNACSQIEGCVFVNTYYDVNEQENYLPKHADGVLTCAMFSSCVPTSENDNWGGQDDPNTIVDSNGYCLSGACSS